MKRCTRCSFELDISFFVKQKNTKDGLQRWCNFCRSLRRSELACREIATEKLCKDCLTIKPAKEFHQSKIMKDGLMSRCYECHKIKYNVLGPAAKAKKAAQYRNLDVWIKRTIKAASKRAKLAGVPCTITPNDIFVPDNCPVLGIPLKINKQGMQDNSPTFDRKIPALGYVPGNVVVISWLANRIKGSWTDPKLFDAVANYLRFCNE